MTPRETAELLAYLGEGWYTLRDGDVAARVRVWHDAFDTFDFPTMMLAAREVLRGQGSVPTVHDVAEAYAAVRRRQELARSETHGLPEGGGVRIPSYVEGVRIAWEAYCLEVRSRGRTPDPAKFRAWVTTLPDPDGR
jgi:hypothetical protein